MVSGTIHRELVRMAEDRANNAEARALALEHEVSPGTSNFVTSHKSK